MVIDLELTLNRFGFYRPAENKLQIGLLRLAVWHNAVPDKHALSVEVNWKRSQKE